MPRPFLTSLRRRLPRWFATALAVLLLCQQVALSAHLCVAPLEAPVSASEGCMAAMDQDLHAQDPAPPESDCAAHCASPVQQAQDLLPLGVPPLPLPVLLLPLHLPAARSHPAGVASDDPAARAWRSAHASTVLLI